MATTESSILRCANCGTANRVGAVASGTPRCAKCQAMLPWLVNATASSFDAEVTASVPVIVDFWAAWCGPCRMIAPILEKLAAQHAGHLKVVKLDVDQHGAIGQRFGAQSIPLLVVFKGGQEADRMVGAAPQPVMEQWLAPHLAPATA